MGESSGRQRVESRRTTVRNGIDVLLEQQAALLKGRRVGLITNPTGTTRTLRSTVDALLDAGVQVRALFGPEHGLRGALQDGRPTDDFVDPRTGIRVYSLYGRTLRPQPEMLRDLEVLVFDIQDVGVRFYTYTYTMAYSLQEAARHGLGFVVLDRPNPITGNRVEGATLEPAFASFVGDYGLPFRHGLTMGELARYLDATQGWGAALHVVTMEGWRRAMWFDETGLPWVMPSPNMPTLETATVYPGTVLFEGTNLSEGRGTCRPFEIIGAPWLTSEGLLPALYANMEAAGVEGALVRELHFIPMFDKHAGQLCRGLQVHVVDRDAYEPVKAAIVLLKTIRDLHPEAFEWRRLGDGTYVIDRLAGTDALRTMVDRGAPLDEILDRMSQGAGAFAQARMPFLLYE
ncbi:MAG TPA: DUF1343 domain-containing protein [Limnochordales bacterium]